MERLQGRIFEPEEVARAALVLLYDEEGFVNGEIRLVDNAMPVGTKIRCSYENLEV